LQWHSYVSSCNFTPQTMKKPDVADDKDFSESTRLSNPAVPLPKKGLNVSWSKDVYSKHESMRDGPGSRTFVVILPCTLDDFSINLHSNYKQAVADVAGVGIDKVFSPRSRSCQAFTFSLSTCVSLYHWKYDPQVTFVSVKATERCTSGIEIDTAVENIPARYGMHLTCMHLSGILVTLYIFVCIKSWRCQIWTF